MERTQLSHTFICDDAKSKNSEKVVRRISQIFVQNKDRKNREEKDYNEQESPIAIPQSAKAKGRVPFKLGRRRGPSNDSGKDAKIILNMTQPYKAPEGIPIKNLNSAKKVRVSVAHLQRLIKEKTSFKQLEVKKNPVIPIIKIRPKKSLTIANPLPGRLNTDEIFPLSAAQTVKMFGKELSNFEKSEMLDYDIIYYIGNGVAKMNLDKRTGYDDDQNDYNTYVGEHINYRYEILDILGKGSFGQALKCIDHKKQILVAVKIIKSKKRLYKQAALEVKILKYIKDQDPHDKAHVVQILDSFMFRNHVVIT